VVGKSGEQLAELWPVTLSSSCLLVWSASPLWPAGLGLQRPAGGTCLPDLADPLPTGSQQQSGCQVAGAWWAAGSFFGGVETGALLVLIPMALVPVGANVVSATSVLLLWIVSG
jgi:hypothetical protein